MRKELFRFSRGSDIWTLTSSDTEVIYNTETYTPAVIGHGERASQTEISKENLTISIDIEHELARELLTYYGDEIMVLTLFIQLDATTEVGWKGRYVSQKPSGDKLLIIVESVFTSLRRPGIRKRYQKTCGHSLYGTYGCKLNSESFALESILLAFSGITVTVEDALLQEDGYYLGGMIRASSDNSLRWIVNHAGNVLTLVRPFEQLEDDGIGASVKIYPGCDHTRPTCISKFNNVLNYGGFPWIPNKNPMDGRSIV